MHAQYNWGGCFMITLGTGKCHSQMHVVVVMLDVRLFCRGIIAIGAEMQNFVMHLRHVSPRVAWVGKLFGAHSTPVKPILALFGKTFFYFHAHLLMSVFLPHVIPQILSSISDKFTQVTRILEVRE